MTHYQQKPGGYAGLGKYFLINDEEHQLEMKCKTCGKVWNIIDRINLKTIIMLDNHGQRCTTEHPTQM